MAETGHIQKAIHLSISRSVVKLPLYSVQHHRCWIMGSVYFFLLALNCRLLVYAIKGLCKHTQVALNAFHIPAFACEEWPAHSGRFSADPGFRAECLQVGVFRWTAVFGVSDRTHAHIIMSMYRPWGIVKMETDLSATKVWAEFCYEVPH